MEANQSFMSTLFSFLSRRLDPTAGRSGAAIDSRQIIREYVVREINLLLWFSLIAITTLLLKHLARLFDLWRKGNPIPGPPCLSVSGCWKLFTGDITREDLTVFLSRTHEKYGSVVQLQVALSQLLVSIKDPVPIKEMLSKAMDKLPSTVRAYHLSSNHQADKVHIRTSYAGLEQKDVYCVTYEKICIASKICNGLYTGYKEEAIIGS